MMICNTVDMMLCVIADTLCSKSGKLVFAGSCSIRLAGFLTFAVPVCHQCEELITVADHVLIGMRA